MLLTLTFFAMLCLLTGLLPLLRCSHWLIRGMDFPRLQLVVFSTILLVAHFVFLDAQLMVTKVLIVITTLNLTWQAWWILPYTFVWPKEVKSSRYSDKGVQLSILTSNVLTPNRNADALIELVERYRPDVLVTLESDLWWERKLDVLESQMPYTIKCPLDNLYGMHVYSRLPLHEQEVCYLVEQDVPSMHVSLELRTGERIRAHFLHPAPPSPTENTTSSERDSELAVVARSVAEADGPVIVTGDLNDVAWSATTRLFRKVSGLLDPRVGRGMFNTYHAGCPLVRWPLDHIFHSRHFTLKSIKRLHSIGSDHFPLLTELSLTPSQGCDQEGIKAGAATRERAKDISKEQSVSDVPAPGEV